VAWHKGARIIRQALASTPGTRVRLEPLGHQTSKRIDIQVVTPFGTQATGLANAEYDLTGWLGCLVICDGNMYTRADW
jgi:hypothetical protein